MVQTAQKSNRVGVIVRDAVIAGAVYAVLLIAAYALVRYPLSPIDILGLLLIGTVGYGVAVIVPIAILLRRRRDNYGAAALGAVLMGAGGVIGGIVVAVLIAQFQMPRGSWTQLPTPPEPIAEIVGDSTQLAYGDALFVRGTGETLYTLKCEYETPCTWVSTDTATTDTSNINIGCLEGRTRNAPPFLGGEIVDSQRGGLCGADYLSQTNYALLADGTLWEWGYFSSAAILIEWLFIIGIGLMYGLVLVLVFILRPAS